MRGIRVLACGAALLYAACDGGPLLPEDGPPSPPDVRAFVAGTALASLDDDGHFRFPAPTPPGEYPMLSDAEAVAIAKGVLRTIRGLAESAERQHGARIDPAAIEPGPAGAWFAVSHLEPLPRDFGWPAIRHYGPKFLVPLFVGATPVAVVAVSAYATNTSVREDGTVVRSGDPSGGEYHVAGIPLSLGGGTLPPSPEAAVEFAARETGRRIVELPRLGTPGNHVFSIGALWRLELESAADLVRRFDGARVSSTVVYVGVWSSAADARVGFQDGGIRLRIFVEAEDQPEFELIAGGETPAREVPLAPGYAVDLHEVRSAAGSGR